MNDTFGMFFLLGAKFVYPSTNNGPRRVFSKELQLLERWLLGVDSAYDALAKVHCLLGKSAWDYFPFQAEGRGNRNWSCWTGGSADGSG
jgi:hypothetical protein